MQHAPAVLSPPVSLDLTNECLWRGTQVLPLRPKTFALLRLLMEHAGQLVPKATILTTVWSETVVGDGVLMASQEKWRNFVRRRI
jgi:DNA-binding winged helix-turn-helix (wHTH) protein